MIKIFYFLVSPHVCILDGRIMGTGPEGPNANHVIYWCKSAIVTGNSSKHWSAIIQFQWLPHRPLNKRVVLSIYPQERDGNFGYHVTKRQ